MNRPTKKTKNGIELYWSESLGRYVSVPQKYCECCDMFTISDDDEIAAQGLCDHCYNELNNDEIIGWRKGE